MTTDIDALASTHGAEEIYVMGDLVHPPDSQKGNVPHVTPEAFDEFWSLVNNASNADTVKHALPGNHEPPLGTFLQSDERATLRQKIDLGDASVYLMNTAASAAATGSPGQGSTQGGIGPNTQWVPHGDIKWLDRQLSEDSNSAKFVAFHAAPYFMGDANLDAHSSDGNFRQGNFYDVCLNYQQIHNVLSSHSNVVAMCGHLYQFNYEGSYNVDGVDYVWKKHYYEEANDSVHTYAYIDIDSTGCTITTVEHSDGATNTILNTTF